MATKKNTGRRFTSVVFDDAIPLRTFETHPGHVIAQACPSCLHTKCGPECKCLCKSKKNAKVKS